MPKQFGRNTEQVLPGPQPGSAHQLYELFNLVPVRWFHHVLSGDPTFVTYSGAPLLTKPFNLIFSPATGRKPPLLIAIPRSNKNCQHRNCGDALTPHSRIQR
ncbi:hypothetical protein ABZZ16_42490 [Streptomyces sp. NPDC006386]|uniref:hypothetical protein n=1 Tax=Streptomyces sp. NPDC006386 TaxID=3156762 RepID=UPI0033B05B94